VNRSNGLQRATRSMLSR